MPSCSSINANTSQTVSDSLAFNVHCAEYAAIVFKSEHASTTPNVSTFAENQLLPFSEAPTTQVVDDYEYTSDSDLDDSEEENAEEIQSSNIALRRGKIVHMGDVAYRT